jgi:hypothetical protein
MGTIQLRILSNPVSVTARRLQTGEWRPEIRIHGSVANLNDCRRHREHEFATRDEAIEAGRDCAEYIIQNPPAQVGAITTKRRKRRQKKDDKDR